MPLQTILLQRCVGEEESQKFCQEPDKNLIKISCALVVQALRLQLRKTRKQNFEGHGIECTLVPILFI